MKAAITSLALMATLAQACPSGTEDCGCSGDAGHGRCPISGKSLGHGHGHDDHHGHSHGRDHGHSHEKRCPLTGKLLDDGERCPITGKPLSRPHREVRRSSKGSSKGDSYDFVRSLGGKFGAGESKEDYRRKDRVEKSSLRFNDSHRHSSASRPQDGLDFDRSSGHPAHHDRQIFDTRHGKSNSGNKFSDAFSSADFHGKNDLNRHIRRDFGNGKHILPQPKSDQYVRHEPKRVHRHEPKRVSYEPKRVSYEPERR